VSGSRLKKSKYMFQDRNPIRCSRSPDSSDEMETAPNVKRSLFRLLGGIKMAGHQDARYIPPRREQDRSLRGWQDRFAIRRLVLAAVVMVVVTLVTFMLIYGHA
jgi:hypothetical protein